MITIDSVILDSNQSTTSGSHQILVSSQDGFLVFMTASNGGVTITATLNGVSFINVVNNPGSSSAQMEIWVFPNPPAGMQTFSYTISSAGVTYSLFSLSGVAKSETTYNTASSIPVSGSNSFITLPISAPQANSLIIDDLSLAGTPSPSGPFPSQTQFLYDNNAGAFVSFKYGYGNTSMGWVFPGSQPGGTYVAIALPPARSPSIWNPNVNFRNPLDIAGQTGLNSSQFASPTYPIQVGAFSPTYFQNSFLHTAGRNLNLPPSGSTVAPNPAPMGGSSVTIDYIQNIGDHTSTTFNYQIPIFSQDNILVVFTNIGSGQTINTITYNGVNIPLVLTYSPSGASLKNIYVMLNPPVGVHTLNITTSSTVNLISAIVLGGVAKNSTNFNTATAETASGTNVSTVISSPEAGSFILSMGGDAGGVPTPYAEQTIIAYDATGDSLIDFRYGNGNTVIGYNGPLGTMTFVSIAFPPARANSMWQPTVSLRNSLDIIGASNAQGLDLGANQTNISYGGLPETFWQNSFLHTVGRSLSLPPPVAAQSLPEVERATSQIIIDKVIQGQAVGTGLAPGVVNLQVNIPSQDAVLVVTGGSVVTTGTNFASVTLNGDSLTQLVQTSIAGADAEIWWMPNPPVGTYTLTVTGGNNTAEAYVNALVVLGVDKTNINVMTTATTDPASTSTIQANINVDAANSLIIDTLATLDVTASPVADQSQNQVFNAAPINANEYVISTYKLSTNGLQNMNYNLSVSVNAALVAVAFRPAHAASLWFPNIDERTLNDVVDTNALDSGLTPATGSYGYKPTIFFKNSFLHTIGREGLSPNMADYALLFDGLQNYVSLGTMGNFGSNLANGFYCKFDIQTTSTSLGMFGTNSDDGNSSIIIGLNADNTLSNSSGKIGIQVKDASGGGGNGFEGGTSNSINFNDGNVHTIEIICNMSAQTIVIEIDGVSKPITYNYQGGGSLSFINFAYNFIVGGIGYQGGYPSNFLACTLDNFQIGTSSSVLYGSYSMNDGPGSTTIADSSGNNNTGTLTGSPLPTWVTGLVVGSTSHNLTLLAAGT